MRPSKKKGSNGILYRANVPKLNVDTPTAKAKDKLKTKQKITCGSNIARNMLSRDFANMYKVSTSKAKLSTADKNIKGLRTSQR